MLRFPLTMTYGHIVSFLISDMIPNHLGWVVGVSHH